MNSTFRNLSTEKSHTKARPVVMQILPSLVTGGVERGTIDVTQALTDAGWKAIVVSNGGPMTHEITRAGGLHIDLPIGKKNPLTAYLNVNRLVRLIREHQVDILHARSRLPAWSGLVAAARTDIKFITTFHGNYSARNSIKRYYNSVMARGDRVIAISEFIRQQICEKYGGIDILISNAGTAIGGSIAEVDDKILRQSFEDNFFSHQNCASEAIKIMKKQNINGCLLFNISKQSVNPGKNFGPYGLPKSALLNLCKQYALDYGSFGIRSNGVNADRIRSGLLNDKMIKSRAKAREVSTDEYMRGNLLLNEVKSEDVAKAFFHLAISKKTTGAVLTVDGGNIAASLR